MAMDGEKLTDIPELLWADMVHEGFRGGLPGYIRWFRNVAERRYEGERIMLVYDGDMKMKIMVVLDIHGSSYYYIH